MSLIITFIIPRCFVQHQNHKMNTKQQTKITKSIQKQKQAKKTYSRKPHKYQTYMSKNYSRVARTNAFTVWLVISKHDYLIPSNKKHNKHWVIFTRYFLVMHNIVDMSFMYHAKSIIKTKKMPSCQNNRNFIHHKSHIYIWFASTSKTAVWFVISKEWL